MEYTVIYLALILIGATMGSFAGATVWRLRARQLDQDKRHKEPYDPKEYKRLKKLHGKSFLSDRSQCLECGYSLKWYDMVPIFSWLFLRGKCRDCKHPIGRFELVMEIGLAAFFIISYMYWPGGIASGFEIAHFILWLASGVAMAILFAYDSKWFLLPDSATVALALLGLAMVGVVGVESGDLGGALMATGGSVLVLGGIYATLFTVSRGKWVGFGDVKLGAVLALLLMDWRLALVALVLANFIGVLVVIPGLATKKLTRTSRVPFGPMLIAGAVLSWFIGPWIVDWYLLNTGLY